MANERILLAEFENVDSLVEGCRRIRATGYTRWDAHTPFPVHGIEKAMGIPPSIMPWIVAVGALTGGTFALSMQYYMAVIDYPIVFAGKPYFALPSFVPITFELTVLLSAFFAVFGMLAVNGLPKWHDVRFQSDRFERATNDRFFISLCKSDPKYADGLADELKAAGAVSIEHLSDEGE